MGRGKARAPTQPLSVDQQSVTAAATTERSVLNQRLFCPRPYSRSYWSSADSIPDLAEVPNRLIVAQIRERHHCWLATVLQKEKLCQNCMWPTFNIYRLGMRSLSILLRGALSKYMELFGWSCSTVQTIWMSFHGGVGRWKEKSGPQKRGRCTSQRMESLQCVHLRENGDWRPPLGEWTNWNWLLPRVLAQHCGSIYV